MELEDKNIIEILNILLKDSGKNINSLEQLSNFKFLSELIKIM
jgi:hypothetical protein